VVQRKRIKMPLKKELGEKIIKEIEIYLDERAKEIKQKAIY
jgi:hypothetical protein